MDDASLDDFLDAGDESSDAAEADATVEDDADTPTADHADDPTAGDGETSTADDDDATAHGDVEATTGTAADEEESLEEPCDVNKAAVAEVEPARSTMTFSPDPGECAACGQSVERRWTDGEDLVCGDCKEW